MNKINGLRNLILIPLVLAGCTSASPTPLPSQPPVIPVSTRTVLPISTESPISTPTWVPSPTKTLYSTRTATPVLTSTPTITPIFVDPYVHHSQALTEDNAAMQMKRLAVVGLGRPHDVEWSPDGKYLAVATGLGIHLYDAGSFEYVRLMDVNAAANHIAFSPDGKSLAVARGGKVGIWDMLTRQMVVEMESGITGGVWTLAYGAGGYVGAFGQIREGLGSPVPQFKLWQASNGRELFSTGESEMMYEETVGVDISPDGKTLAYMRPNGLVLRNFATGSFDMVFDGRSLVDVAFSPDGTKLFASGDNSSITLSDVVMLDPASGEAVTVLNQVDCQYLSRKGGSILCYGAHTTIVFDPHTGAPLHTFDFSSEIEDADIHPQGRFAAVVVGEEIIIIDLQTEQEVKVLEFHVLQDIAAGLIILDGVEQPAAASMNNQGQIYIWSLSSGKELRVIQTGDAGWGGVAFSPDRQTLASVENQRVRLWNIATGSQTNEYTLNEVNLDPPLVFSPDGGKVAMNVAGNILIELNLQSGSFVERERNPHQMYFYSLDSHLMVWDLWTGGDSEITLVDLDANIGIEVSNVESGKEYWAPRALAASTDLDILAAGLDDGDILIWNARTGKLLQTLKGHEVRGGDGGVGAVSHLTFNPHNQLLVSSGYDGTTRLWNIHTGELLSTLWQASSASFTPDGRLLLLEGDGVIYVYGIPPSP